MSKENHLSYQEVANIANLLSAEGKRVTLEYVRRELGRGTHSQIAVFLSRWQQAQRAHKPGRAKNPSIKVDSNSTSKARYGASKVNVHTLSHRSETVYKERYTRKQGNVTKDSYINKEKRIATKKSAYTAVLAALKKPFSLERLNQEATIVKSLFWALYQIKSMRLNTLEIQQRIESNLLVLRMKHESGVRQIKQQNHAKIEGLLAEFNQIKAASDHKISALRQQLAL